MVTCADNFVVKFGRVFFEICERTDTQTHSSQYSVPLLGVKWKYEVGTLAVDG